ncbi:MAG: terpene cyclase/mutase family protein, partial [Oscillospiraceae bacterium]|nr:terpene cyclase/mutase family protein [Oscillospiraceae bacterium]
KGAVLDKDRPLATQRSTENSRLVLALSAIGKDAANVGGVDITAPLSDLDWVARQGNNGAFYALLALDCGGYCTAQARGELLGYILANESAAGGWAAAKRLPASADYTAMALQALAAHRDDAQVSAAIGRAVPVLSAMQNANGSFGFEEEGANTESTSQVIIALASLGIDPMTDVRFVKADGNPVSALLAYQLSSGGFRHKLADAAADGMATDQSARALVAYDRFVNGGDPLYTNLYTPHAHAYGEWVPRMAATCTGPGVECRACGQCLTAEETRAIEALGHSYESTVQQPTKQAGGYTVHSCSRCGSNYVDSYTAKLPRTSGFGWWDWVKFILFFGWMWME